MKKAGVLVFIVSLVVIGTLYVTKTKSLEKETVLYTLDNQENKELYVKHPYLKNISIVSFWDSYNSGELVMASSDKEINKTEFIEIVEDYVKYGYVQQGGFNQTMKITKRNISEDTEKIVITDEGSNTVYNDTGTQQNTKSKIILEYKYNKTNKTLYFTAF